jgi:hypothetical protein
MAAPAAAGSIHARVEFDPSSVRVEATDQGMRVSLGSEEVAAGELPRVRRLFYVPAGQVVADVRVTATGTQRQNHRG